MNQKQQKLSEKKGLVKQVSICFAWFLVIAGVFLGGYKIISQENVLPIKEISISGEFNQISAQELHGLVVDGFQGNFFTLSVNEIYQKFYALPWVEQIWVHRIWPDKINIEIRENKVVAILKGRGLLNDKGKVFIADAATVDGTLPVFVVANNYETEAIDAYKQYVEILNDVGLGIRQFNFDRRKSQSLFLSNGIALTLGRVNTEKRLMRFVSVYDSKLIATPAKIEGVDLRYTNGFAVKWKQAKLSMNNNKNSVNG